MAHYDTFIVRVWRSIGTDGPQWSARLEHVQRPGMTQFNSLEALLEHLRAAAGPLSVEPSDQVRAGRLRPDDGAGTEGIDRGG